MLRQAPGRRVAWVGGLSAALLLAACSGPGGSRGMRGPPLRPVAEPGKVVAAEMGLARSVREKGQWTAFAEYAAPDAVLFVPRPVAAKDWLKRRANPPAGLVREPARVVSSCDGQLAASFGRAISPDNRTSDYLTLWQRQPDGAYRWLLDTEEETEAARIVLDDGRQALVDGIRSDFVITEIADCARPDSPAGQPGGQGGASPDGTMRWSLAPQVQGGGEHLTVEYWDGSGFRTIYDRDYSAAPGS